jgi:hypothetical protein
MVDEQKEYKKGKKKLTEAHKKHISQAKKGVKQSIEHRKATSRGHIGLKYPNRNTPKHYTQKHRENISKGLKRYFKNKKNANASYDTSWSPVCA